MKNLFASVVLSLGVFSVNAQLEIDGGPVNVPSDGIIDGVYLQEHIPTKRMIPYEFVREADVIWSKRVWEAIDMREKINHPMYFPFDDYDSEGNWVRNSSRWSLWTVIKTHIMKGDLTVFSPYNPFQFTIMDGDQLKYPVLSDVPGGTYETDSLLRDKLFFYMGTLGAQSTTALPDSEGNDSIVYNPDGSFDFVYPERDKIWVMAKDIVQFRMKEDWFFDKERSVLDVRIIAIAPVIYDKDDQGQVTGLKELFWLYFPHCRLVFNNYFVYNEQNDAQWMSFDDLFWKRRFNATKYKESNIYDRKIETYRYGTDALYESNKITEEIRTIEHDVWSF